jgi:stage III sporulation protein SpoIIIAA
MEEKGDVEGLIKELRNKDVKVRIDVVKALGELKYTRGLIVALKNDHPEVRILDMMGKIMEGTPLEKRARLLGFAQKRARTHSSLAEWEAEWRE